MSIALSSLISVVVLAWLCVSSIVISEPLRRSGDEQTSLSLYGISEPLHRSTDVQDSLWELPIYGPTCDATTPVCGEGGIRFESACHAILAGVRIQETEVCAKTDNQKTARSCRITCFRADPVCGVDGVTYWCGATEANCAGVEVAHTGFCHLRSDGTGEKGSRAAQSLFLLHLLWLGVAGFIVIAGIL